MKCALKVKYVKGQLSDIDLKFDSPSCAEPFVHYT